MPLMFPQHYFDGFPSFVVTYTINIVKYMLYKLTLICIISHVKSVSPGDEVRRSKNSSEETRICTEAE